MSTNQNPITAAQIGKIIQGLNGIDSDIFQARGIPMINLVTEYLRQRELKPISLVIIRQVLGLPIFAQAFARVSWIKAIPTVRLSECAVRSGGKKEVWTTLARIYPQDVGLPSEGTVPGEVLELALKWGFRLIPHGAFSALLQSEFGGQKSCGYMMAYLESAGDRADKNRSLFVNNHSSGLWSVSERSPMERCSNRRLSEEDWSILVAAETTETPSRND